MPRILLADDDPHLRAVLTRFLTREGYHVDTAADGQEAVAMSITSPPDLLITDLLMPQLTGWSVFARVRSQDPQLPIILISGSPSGVPDQETLYAEHAVFLPKPLGLAHLLATVRRLLAAVRATESLQAS